MVLIIFIFLSVQNLQTRAEGDYKPVEDQAVLVSRLNASSAGTETIQSNFLQEKHLEFLDETILSRGRFWFRKEDRLRWSYQEPFEYEIIINGGKFLIRDGESVSTYDIDSNEAFRQINEIITGMVQGKVLEDRQFEISAFENDRSYLVKLQPGDGNIRKVISDMEIYFDKKDLTVSKIVISESEIDFTVITFIDKRFNETIPDSIFSTDF